MVGSEGSSLCFFLFPLSSLLLLPPQVLMDGPRLRRGGKKSLAGDVGKLFECPARRGARGNEIVKLCLGCARRRAAHALPGARAREGGCASPGCAPARQSPACSCARVPGRCAPSASTRAVR